MTENMTDLSTETVRITSRAKRMLEKQAAEAKRTLGAQVAWLIEEEDENRRIAAAAVGGKMDYTE